MGLSLVRSDKVYQESFYGLIDDEVLLYWCFIGVGRLFFWCFVEEGQLFLWYEVSRWLPTLIPALVSFKLVALVLAVQLQWPYHWIPKMM